MEYKVICLLIVSTAIYACGGGSGDGTTEARTLSGEWQTPCYQSKGGSDPSFNEYSLEVMSFSSSIISFLTTVHSDSNCQIVVRNRAVYEVEYKIGDTITTQSGLEAQEIDIFDSLEDNTSYSIIYVDGDALYFGDVVASSPEERTDKLDFDNYSTRI